jgi:hypothetical protein
MAWVAKFKERIHSGGFYYKKTRKKRKSLLGVH